MKAQNYQLIEVNDSIKINCQKLIEKSFKNKDFSMLFDKTVICGPILWGEVKRKGLENNIIGININYNLIDSSSNCKIVEGKAIQSINSINEIWRIIIIGNAKNMILRFPTSNELSLYASLLGSNIEEPIYIILSNNNKFLIHIDNRNYKVLFIEKLY